MDIVHLAEIQNAIWSDILLVSIYTLSASSIPSSICNHYFQKNRIEMAQFEIKERKNTRTTKMRWNEFEWKIVLFKIVNWLFVYCFRRWSKSFFLEKREDLKEIRLEQIYFSNSIFNFNSMNRYKWSDVCLYVFLIRAYIFQLFGKRFNGRQRQRKQPNNSSIEHALYQHIVEQIVPYSMLFLTVCGNNKTTKIYEIGKIKPEIK